MQELSNATDSLQPYPSVAQIYRAARVQKTSARGAEAFHNVSRIQLAKGIKSLVKREGPIHKDVLKRHIADIFSVRMGTKISRELDYSILLAYTSGYVKVDGYFLWSPNMKSAPLRIYQDGEQKREIGEIPPQELSLAILECVKNSMSIMEDDLIRETARLFGLRATSKVSSVILVIIRSLYKTKSLRQKNGKIVIKKSHITSR